MHDRNAGQLDNIPGLDGRRRPMAQRNATQLGQRLKETIPDYENARLQVAQALGLLAEDLPSPPQDVAMAVIKVSIFLPISRKRATQRGTAQSHHAPRAVGGTRRQCRELEEALSCASQGTRLTHTAHQLGAGAHKGQPQYSEVICPAPRWSVSRKL